MTAGEVLAVNVQVSPQFTVPLHSDLCQRAARAALSAAGWPASGELTVVIGGEAQVQALNREYRGVDAPTDVLAFGERQDQTAFVTAPDTVPYLGDIVISYPRAVEQATAYGHGVDVELSILVVHGVLHLLGYDHETTADREEMWRLQAQALEELDIRWDT